MVPLRINMAEVKPRTKPNRFAEPFGNARIPKAKAIGLIPLPKFVINCATKKRLVRG